MAKPRTLRKPPIQEAVLQFNFVGAIHDRASLEKIAESYVSGGWSLNEVRSVTSTVQAQLDDSTSAVLNSSNTFAGFVVRDPSSHRHIRFELDHFAASIVHAYEKWESLETLAREAFDAFVATGQPSQVLRFSTRFINRIPPFADLARFDQTLTRPPLPIDELPGAHVTDFLRRHVIKGLDGGFVANLAIGTAENEADEVRNSAQALLIDVDVMKDVDVGPVFDLLRSDMATARQIKNELFFGCLQEAVVEKFT